MLDYLKLLHWYHTIYDKQPLGLYVTLDDLEFFKKRNSLIKFSVDEIGKSEENKMIYSFKIGTGCKKVLIWSQMHGNEATGTKALFDLFSFFESSYFESLNQLIFENLTLLIIPILNPDGAVKFTRVNSKGIDLNRDAVDLKAKESQILKSVLDDFKPDFCFNLHDQRSIFSVSGTQNPATISFLAPSIDVQRSLTESRKTTMSVIVAMNQLLQQLIPDQIGRYTDEFYPTATGDNFQKSGFHTILIEAGYYKNDDNREEVRKFNFLALLQGLFFIATAQNFNNYEPYFSIPVNNHFFYDVIYRNAVYENKLQDVALQYQYRLKNHDLERFLVVEKTGDLSNYKGHFEENFFGKPFFLI